MDIQPIRTKADHDAALERIAELMSAEAGTHEGDELDILATLVEVYEQKNFPIAPADPIEAINFRIEQLGLERKDLEPYLGSRHRVSEVLNRRRGLSLEMIRRLHEGLKIPLDVLVGRAA
jgi:HTH-type transcriptional regulator/antitoxin HigA